MGDEGGKKGKGGRGRNQGHRTQQRCPAAWEREEAVRLPAAPLCPPAELSTAEGLPDEQNDEQREGHKWQGGNEAIQRLCLC